MNKIHNLHSLLPNRRELRQNPTPQEEKLWWYLKDKRLGKKFRRQHSVGGYVLDFYCKEKKLIIEIDGEIHNSKEAQEYDKVRDRFFLDLDYKLLRFKNREVETNIEAILRTIKENL